MKAFSVLALLVACMVVLAHAGPAPTPGAPGATDAQLERIKQSVSGPDEKVITNFYPYLSYMPAYRSTYLVAPWQHWSFGPTPRPFYPQPNMIYPYNYVQPFPFPYGGIYNEPMRPYPYMSPIGMSIPSYTDAAKSAGAAAGKPAAPGAPAAL